MSDPFRLPAAASAQRFDVRSATCHRIAAGDTVRLAVLRRPDALLDVSVVFEVWDPGGSQPINSHPDSVETFLFLRGTGIAISDGVETPVAAGQLLVLPPKSPHRVVNSGRGRLYAITTMFPDCGFADLIEAGPVSWLDEADLAVLSTADTTPECPS